MLVFRMVTDEKEIVVKLPDDREKAVELVTDWYQAGWLYADQ